MSRELNASDATIVTQPVDDAIDEFSVAVSVQRGWEVMVASDLHLRALSDDNSASISSDLARQIDAWIGPGVLVLAGDTFELSEEPNNSPQRALTAHPRLTETLRSFADREDRVLVVLAGEHDERLLSSATDRREVGALGALVGRRCDLSIDTGAGVELVRVEHVSAQTFTLADDTNLQGFAASGNRETSCRFYVALQRVWWIPIVVPIVIVLAAIVFAADSTAGRDPIYHISLWRWLYFVGVTITMQVVLAAVILTVVKWRVVDRVESIDDLNRCDRAHAAQLAREGFSGYVAAGSHCLELVDLGECWYANPGCARRSATSRPAHFGMPAIFAQSNQLSWVEIEAGARLHVRIVASRHDDRPTSRIERLACKTQFDVPRTTTCVARLEPGTVWPAPTEPFRALTRTRRSGAAGLFVIGLVDLMSALTPPLRGRLHDVRQIIPVGTPSVAAGLVAAAGIGLMMLACGLLRGRRLAWQLALAMLLVSTVGHLVKGLDVEEATLAGLLAIWLATHRQAFRSPAGAGSLRRAVLIAASSLAGIGLAAAGWMSIEGHLAVGRSLSVAFGRMIGVRTDVLPRHEQLLASALPAVAVAAVLVVGWYVLRSRDPFGDDPVTTERTWNIVREHGRGTLDYFALRDDKRHFIYEDTVVAYSVVHGTAVVSPDPVGPTDQRSRAWRSFRGFAVTNGWRVAALGAGSEWLPIYRSSGMWTMYIGDESVVDVQRFSLDGGRHKSLRQAVNRVAKAGYTVEFHDPAQIDPSLASELRLLAKQSRQGSVERGFSMTLSRLFDPRDQNLLMAVARDAAGRPAAFCQFVPAAGIDGYSLDVMRRNGAPNTGGTKATRQAISGDTPGSDLARHPNGLTEFVVVRTIEHLRDQGHHGLGLHFATMRALLAGQIGSRLWHRTMAELMRRMSDDMQIESLWKFNAKFDPTWLPRYLAIDTPGSTLFAGLAIAKVESLWDLPFIGRFLQPRMDTLDALPATHRTVRATSSGESL